MSASIRRPARTTGNNEQVGRACNATGQHGVYIPAGNTAINNVLVIPERIVGTVTLEDGRTLNCTPDNDPDSPTYGQVNFIRGLDVPQYPGCFFIRTIPEITDPNVNLHAVVGSCPEIPASAPDRLAVIARTDDANNPSYVQALKPASTVIGGVDFLDCNEPLSPLQSLAQAAKKLIPFYAEPVEAGKLATLKGGDAPSFSDFVWMVPSQDEKTAGDNQVGLTGTVLPEPLTVYVSDEVSSSYRATPNLAVAGATVTFTAADVGLSYPAADNSCDFGSANTLPVTTGLSGEAKVCVTLPGAVGTYNVFASGYGIGQKNEFWPSSTNNVGKGPYSHYTTWDQSKPDSENPVPYLGGPITLPNPPAEVAFEVTACQPGVGSATPDGILEPNEYQCSADPVPFEANVGGGKTTGYIYRMQADGNLYFAVAIPVSEQQSLKVNTLTLYLNTDGASELAAGHDVLIVDGTLPVGQQFSDNFWTTDCPKGQSFCAVNDINATNPAGTKDGNGGCGLDSGENGLFYFYEISHPLNGPDARDIKFTGTLHAFFTIRGLGKGAKGDTEFPGPFGVYDQLEP